MTNVKDEDEDLEALLLSKFRKSDRSLAARAVKESKPLGYSERRKMSPKSERTSQTNLKFRTEFKKHLVALAMKDNLSMTEYIERAVMAYEQRN